MKIAQFVLTIILLAFSITSNAIAFETEAEFAILIDYDTGKVLFEKNSEIAMAPSSMSKLMTTYMVFDELKKKKLSLDDKFLISEKAWRKQGSKMFVHINDHVRVEDLLLGVIVQSGNDACIALAEGISGTEEAFAASMNKKAKDLGLTNSNFTNSTGWPDANHVMSSKDLAILAKKLLEDFPEYYNYFSLKKFVFNGITQENRNMLLTRNIGVDGLKTGHADDAGYGITASAKKDDRRLILVINGLSGTVARANEAEKLLSYGFLNFENLKIATKGQIIENARVWQGKEKFLPLISDQDIIITLPKDQIDKVKVTIEYDHPIKAPIKKGDQIAEMIIEIPNFEKKTISIKSNKTIDKNSFFKRIFNNLRNFLLGKKI
jgi:D-alanyl-D-alanine carboxypeptidase (penicillin-binding protein 5/6)